MAYLRAEGMNISVVMDDTDDVSVQRGTSLLLRQAVKDIADKFSEELEIISIGASVGLYRIKNNNDPTTLRNKVVELLNSDKNYLHLTFTVDITEEIEFRTAVEYLIAANRRRQLRQPSLALPASGTNAICEFDCLRPADNREKLKKRKYASSSVRARFEYGRKNRNSFYKQELGHDPNLSFTDDLETLSSNPEWGNLDGKIAVVYFDGNKFGNIQKACGCPEELKKWDEYIQGKRKRYLAQLLEMIRRDDAFHVKYTSEKKGKNKVSTLCRLEVLMWGGDEFMLVVPAWRGLEVVHHFYDCSKGWQYNGQKLTHAGSVVFCNHKAPLMRIRPLAKELAERVKERGGGNRFEYLVLESIDYPAESLSDFWRRRYGQLAGKRDPLGAVEGWPNTSEKFKELRENIPRRQLHELALALVHDPEVADKRRRRMETVMDPSDYNALRGLLSKLFPGASNGDWSWLHLLELWDYISPERTKVEDPEEETGQIAEEAVTEEARS